MTPRSAPGPVTGYLDWYFDQYPVHADALGAVGYAHRLGDFSAVAFDSRDRQAAQWLAREKQGQQYGGSSDDSFFHKADSSQSAAAASSLCRATNESYG